MIFFSSHLPFLPKSLFSDTWFLYEVIFQTKAPFSNQKTMNIGVWVLKKVTFELRSANYFHVPKTTEIATLPPVPAHLTSQMLSKKHSNIVEFFEFYEVATFHPMWPEKRGGKKTQKQKASNKGWFQLFFIFTHTWGNDPIWRAYFSDGLTPPTSLNSFLFCCFKIWYWFMVYVICGYVSLCLF